MEYSRVLFWTREGAFVGMALLFILHQFFIATIVLGGRLPAKEIRGPADPGDVNRTITKSENKTKPVSMYKDKVWELFFDGFWNETLENRKYLLKFYDCPFFEETGLAQNESLASSRRQPYSAIPNEDTWMLFERAYFAALDLGVPPPKNESKETSWRGMRIPHEIRYTPGVGRSVHVTTFVPNGTTVWLPTVVAAFAYDTVEFDDVTYKNEAPHSAFLLPSYRRFIEYLNEEYHKSLTKDSKANNWVCDALMWTWITPSAAFSSFDMGSLFNNAMGNNTEANIDEYFEEECSYPFGFKEPSNCFYFAMKASRDIQPGEEIRYNYTQYKTI